MRRREFITLIGGAAAWPIGARAQLSKRPAQIGWLSFYPKDSVSFKRFYQPFLRGLQELGYVEGRDFNMLIRFADGHTEWMPKLAAELVQLDPDIIVAPATIQAVAVKKATDAIPIVVPILADAVGFGLIANEARPGGNVTGISPYVKGLPAKQLELAREIVPKAQRIGLLDDVSDPKAPSQRQEIEAAGQQLGVKIVTAEVRSASDIGQAYQRLATERVEAIIVESSNMLVGARKQIAEAAAAEKLPSVYPYREHVDAGGLVSYGVDLIWCLHRAAYYVDRILKGTKPADLPVEFPTKLQMVVNLTTAKALGLEIPAMLLARADEVIE
jgi:putative ABC transport system substrate-binding protein